MVVTGGNDPRVPPSEANQMVVAVRANGVPVSPLLAADEGHGYEEGESGLSPLGERHVAAHLLAEPQG